jgi:lipoprotein-releasing system ATP-binding protein
MTLIASEIHKTFDTPAPLAVLRGVSLRVEPGESLAIMGKSGEGKSTLLHILGTLEKPSSGTLSICGKNPEAYPEAALRNRHIGFVFQAFNLLEEYTLLDNVLMPARIARRPVHPGSPSHTRALALLERVGLRARAPFLAKLLSGGEKQRGAIARALINDPALMLVDEPSGNLDSSLSADVHHLLVCCAKEEGKTLVAVTHDEELAALCDRVLTLKEGKLL